MWHSKYPVKFILKLIQQIILAIILFREIQGIVRIHIRQHLMQHEHGLAQDALSGLLFGVQPLDPVVIGAAVLLLVVIALLACALPARRATRIAPWAVLAE